MAFRLDPKAIAKLQTAGQPGLRAAAQALHAASLAEVPVATGELRDSAYVDVDGNEAVVGYQDPKAPAAHENMTVRYRQGRSAKFLEGPLNRLRPALLATIAAGVKRSIGS